MTNATPTNLHGFYLIWNPEGRAPTFRHATAASAKAEAERLSRAHPNQSFYVLRTTGVARSITETKTSTAFAATSFDHETAPPQPKYIPELPAPAVPVGWYPAAVGNYPPWTCSSNVDVIYDDNSKFFNRPCAHVLWHRASYWRYCNGTRET